MIYIYKAKKDDSQIVLTLIKELVEYVGTVDKVIDDIEKLEKTLFSENPKIEVILIKEEGLDEEIAGFALYFHNYSAVLCKYGICIGDIYIREKFRGKGLGRAVFQYYCRKAIAEDCEIVEWGCSDRDKLSIDFYLKIGAEQMHEWTVYRLNREEIEKMANNGK
jgi:GNAT superfamily N-acetyltransferase